MNPASTAAAAAADLADLAATLTAIDAPALPASPAAADHTLIPIVIILARLHPAITMVLKITANPALTAAAVVADLAVPAVTLTVIDVPVLPVFKIMAAALILPPIVTTLALQDVITMVRQTTVKAASTAVAVVADLAAHAATLTAIDALAPAVSTTPREVIKLPIAITPAVPAATAIKQVLKPATMATPSMNPLALMERLAVQPAIHRVQLLLI